jgi:hypothetical protein
MGLQEHYRGLLKKSGELQEEMLSDNEALTAFTIAHAAADDIEKLIAAVKDRPEAKLMRLAMRELQFAFMAASFAHYRHAYISTRLFMEMMLGAIHFSAFEIKLRKWMNNSQDIVWASLVDKDNGPFAKSFISAFSPDFANHGPQFHAIAEGVYRECSEYVHGNMSTHGSPDQPLKYDRVQLIEWTDRMRSVRLIILFTFIARYANFLSEAQLENLEPILLEELGDNPAVQALFAN